MPSCPAVMICVGAPEGIVAWGAALRDLSSSTFLGRSEIIQTGIIRSNNPRDRLDMYVDVLASCISSYHRMGIKDIQFMWLPRVLLELWLGDVDRAQTLLHDKINSSHYVCLNQLVENDKLLHLQPFVETPLHTTLRENCNRILMDNYKLSR